MCIFISIGIQCTNATFLKNNNMRSNAYPFDWMFSTPKFVFEMLELLLDTQMSLEDIVKHHFFKCDKKANIKGVENYYTDVTGFALFNTKYNVIFPHDNYCEDVINKYIRRFERLKIDILNIEEEICFIYSSQSSFDNGNFTIDGVNIIADVYLYINKIYHLIKKYRNKFKIIIFDALNNEDKNYLNKDIILYELHKCNHYGEVLSQMMKYIDKF
jgi:hypothetical protein